MERLTFLHLSGPRRGEVDVLGELPAVIGSEPGLDVVVVGVAPRHARLVREDAEVVLQDAGSGRETYLAGQPVREAVLRDGDVLELGRGGPRLRFGREGAQPVPRRPATKWGRTLVGARALEASGHFRAAVREKAVRTSRAFRAVLVGILAASLALMAFSYRESRRLEREVARLRDAVRYSEEQRERFQRRIEEERKRAEADRQSLEARIEESRAREEALSRKLAEATSGEVQTLKGELQLSRARLAALEEERAAGERIIREYGTGVCLIVGSYAFYDASGRALRYKLDEDGQVAKDADGSETLEVEAAGPVHTVDYFGTGFLVDRRGLVLTNRHVAEPWWKDATAQTLTREGYKPRFVSFRAFFPRLREAFKLDFQRSSESVDLALLRVDLGGRKVPVLPLDATGRGAVAGQPVVVVGYPTGLEAILAKADSSVVQEILEAHGTSSERVTEALSRKGLIRPSTTQGHIGDITKTDIVFDAPTTQGGSGGPVFNKAGQVIAVEYAVLPRFGGNAFGLPIRHAIELLKAPRRAGD